MSSGICKNDKEEKKEKKSSSNTFNFWIYFGIITLGLLLILIIIFIIYSFFSSNNKNDDIKEIKDIKDIKLSSSPPVIESTSLSSYQFNNPSMISTSLPPPQKLSVDNISSFKKPFLSSLMTKTTEDTSEAISSLMTPLYNRNIPKTTGGFRCMNKMRF